MTANPFIEYPSGFTLRADFPSRTVAGTLWPLEQPTLLRLMLREEEAAPQTICLSVLDLRQLHQSTCRWLGHRSQALSPEQQVTYGILRKDSFYRQAGAFLRAQRQ